MIKPPQPRSDLLLVPPGRLDAIRVVTAKGVTAAGASTVEFGTRRVVIVLGVMLASLLGRIDGTIVNVALPTVQGNLGASYDEATWVIIAYLMANVVVIPLTPWLADRFGRRNAFVGAIAGFTIFSFLCATATSVQELVLYRVLQGGFAGGIDAAANTVLTSTFPSNKMGVAQSIFSSAAVAAPPVGLLLGGVLTDNLSWQWCFLINVPLGAAAAVLLGLMLRQRTVPKSIKPAGFDGLGLALLAAGPSLIVYFLSEGDRYDWFSDAGIVLAAIFGTVATASFILWELYGTTTPIVDLRIFKVRQVAIGAILMIGNAFVYLATMVFLPQYTQEILGYTPTQSGLLILFRAVSTTLFVPVASMISGRGLVDNRLLIGGGFVLMAIGSYLQCLAMSPTTNSALLALPLIVAGIGNAFTFGPLFVTIIGSVPHHNRSKAAAVTSVMIQLGGALATAVLISSLHQRSVYHQAMLASSAVLSREVVADFVHRYGAAALSVMVDFQARAFGYADVSFFIAVVAIAMAPVALALGRPRIGRS